MKAPNLHSAFRVPHSAFAGFSAIIALMEETRTNGAAAAAEPALPPIRLLVVDNDEALARAMEESLAKVGYECVVATSGPEGARKIETDTFDIVVTDLVMNDIDGM